MPGQTVTGSSGADTLFGSTGADIINAGAGNDTVSGSLGADTIDGGTGTNTITNAGMVGTALEGTGTGDQTGVVINLGTTAITNVGVLNGTAQNLSGGLASVPAGGIAYVYNSVANTNSAFVDTVSNFDNVTLSANGINMVVGNDNANVVVGGSGTDNISTGKGADTINVGDAVRVAATDLYAGGGGADSVLVMADDNATGAVFDDMTGVETITVVESSTAATENIKITLTSTAASTQAFTVNAAALTNAGAVFTFIASDAEVDGALTITGGAGNDIITTGDGAATVTGGGGNDAITLDAGTNTVNIPFGGAGIDTLTAFIGGTDIIDLTGTSDVNDAAGSDIDLDGFLIYDTDASINLTEGLTVFGGLTLTAAVDAGATLTAAEIATFLADVIAGGAASKVSVATAADVAYVIIEGAAGASTLAKVTGGADTTIDTADVTIIAHFAALDSNTLTAANFADFVV
jgi:Ca2+-binding RTX toxin-like protein